MMSFVFLKYLVSFLYKKNHLCSLLRAKYAFLILLCEGSGLLICDILNLLFTK